MIELMVTVVIVALVLTTIYSMMSAGNRIFAQGDAKADIQSNLRVSGNFISDKLRYASEVEILSDKPADMTTSTKEYIYAEDGVLKYYDGYNISNVPGTLDGVETDIYFEDQNSQTVLIRINGTLRGQTYSVETSAYLLNIGVSALAAGSGAVIEFEPGVPVIADINARPIEKITIKTEPLGITTATVDGDVTFVADVEPEDASKKTVEWILQPSTITYATIESTSATTGLLQFNGAEVGDSVTVYARALDGSGVISDFPIVITVSEDEPVSAVSITVESDYDYIFKTNGQLQMKAKITPENATNLSVNWSLNVGKEVAEIRDDGLLQTKGTNSSNGTIAVTATIPETGDSHTKYIQIIDNINGIDLQQGTVSRSGSGNGTIFTIDVDCRLITSSGTKLATMSNGVKSIAWSSSNIQGEVQDISWTEKGNGSIEVKVVGHHNKKGSFDLIATITPISGVGMAKTIKIAVP